jgi:hypothetical protein
MISRFMVFSIAWLMFLTLTTYCQATAGLPSQASNFCFVARPPANPVGSPVAPMTRWQGAMIERGFGRLPRRQRDTRLALRSASRSARKCGFRRGDCLQRLPHRLLKGSPLSVERYGERVPISGQVSAKLPLGVQQNRMFFVLRDGEEPDPDRIIVRPRNGDQSLFAGDNFQVTDW